MRIVSDKSNQWLSTSWNNLSSDIFHVSVYCYDAEKLGFCSQVPNWTLETEFWRSRKEQLYCFAKQRGDTMDSCSWKLCGPNPGGFHEEFYSNGAMVGLLIKLEYLQGMHSSHLVSGHLLDEFLWFSWCRPRWFWPPDEKNWLIWKDPDGGKDWRREEKGTTEDEWDGWWGGWMASLTQWTWVCVNSGSWYWTGRPGVLQFMGSQRVGHDWATELNWTDQVVFLWYEDCWHFKST